MIRHIQLLYFAEIVDRGSFSAASKSLYVSQSALSQSLAGLEEELGVKLIRRSKSGVSLTYFGHRVYEDAKVLISSLQNFESGWRSLITEGSDLKGEVYIQCTPGAESYLSKNIVSDLRESYPNIELHISPSGQMRFGFQSFINSPCALGIGACLSSRWEEVRAKAEEAGLICEFFGTEKPQVLLSSRHPLAKEPSLSREQVAQLELLSVSSAPPISASSLFKSAASRVPTNESLVRLVANSDCAGFLAASSIRRELAEFRGRVRLIPISFEDECVKPVAHYLIHAPESELKLPELRTLELLRRYPYTD